MSQAELPRGLGGRVLGQMMAFVNADMERQAVDQLELDGTERVLAVGFGAGVGLVHVARRIGGERAAGIEPSALMLDRARRRLSQNGVSASTCGSLPLNGFPGLTTASMPSSASPTFSPGTTRPLFGSWGG